MSCGFRRVAAARMSPRWRSFVVAPDEAAVRRRLRATGGDDARALGHGAPRDRELLDGEVGADETRSNRRRDDLDRPEIRASV